MTDKNADNAEVEELLHVTADRYFGVNAADEEISDLYFVAGKDFIQCSDKRRGVWTVRRSNVGENTEGCDTLRGWIQSRCSMRLPDVALEFAGRRFRGSALITSSGCCGIVLRGLPNAVRPLGQIGFVENRCGLHMGGDLTRLREWGNADSGLLLVTGRTGMGKSTTLSSLLDEINNTRQRHILTLEAPVEYMHSGRESIFTQLQVPDNEESFAAGVRNAMRRAPDIIVIGEINDRETAIETLRAAETGHLVMATLHTGSAVETVDRMTSLASSDDARAVRQVLSTTLLGIVTQELSYGDDGQARFLYEMLVVDGKIRSALRDGNREAVKFEMDNSRGTSSGSRPMSFIRDVLGHGNAP